MHEKADKKVEKLLNTFASNRLYIFAQATVTTVIIMAGLGGGGWLLDQYIGTFPGLFITGLVIAFPATQIYLYKKFKKYGKEKTK